MSVGKGFHTCQTASFLSHSRELGVTRAFEKRVLCAAVSTFPPGRLSHLLRMKNPAAELPKEAPRTKVRSPTPHREPGPLKTSPDHESEGTPWSLCPERETIKIPLDCNSLKTSAPGRLEVESFVLLLLFYTYYFHFQYVHI